jgi:hypothetical protein
MHFAVRVCLRSCAVSSALFIVLAGVLSARDARADPPDVVLYASEAAVVKGHWRAASSSGAAGTRALISTDSGWASLDAPLAAPAHYFEMTFEAPAATTYRVWLRLRATGNSKWNDAVWVQFSDALLTTGATAYRIGTTAGLMVNLERCAGCGVSSWGWQNTAWWLSQPSTIRFAASGTHTIRVQTREDGVEVDQIVLSPATYLSSAPGQPLNDTVIVPKTSSSSSLMPYGGAPASVPGTIDATRFDNGGPNVAYYDTTAGNTGGAFRATDVDLQSASGGGYNVGWTAPGEWLKYTLDVASTGSYSAQVAVASTSGGSMRLEFGGSATTVTVPNTGGWQQWTTVAVPVSLVAGRQVMTVRFTTAGINLRAVTISTAPAAPPPSTGQTLVVNAGGNLQAALDIAQPGDTVVLQAGASFVGNFVLPAKSATSTAYITIRSSAPDSSMPGPGTRMTPAYAAQLPKLRSPNTMGVITTAPGAHHYRLLFLELRANANGAGDIVSLGKGSAEQNTLGSVPHHLILDRLYIHGDPTVGQKRGVALNSASTDVVNSYISDIKSATQDSQAIAGWNGPGPFNIVNNYLEGAAENVLFGGADPRIPNLVPSDITIVRNHFFKPLSWRSQQWRVKNLLELKNAQRVVVDGNLFENNWLAAQSGYAILLKSVNQEGTAPWSVVQDVEFTNNVIRHVASAFNILGRETKYPSVAASNITIRNNLIEDVSAAKYGGNGRFIVINGGSAITVDHNTVFNDGMPTVAPDVNASAGFVFTNNIIQDNGAAIKGAGTAAGTATIAKFFPGAQVFSNLFVGSPAASYPAANFFPANLAAVGFVNLSGGNYRLGTNSIYRQGGTDGKDPGCDFEALGQATGMGF